MNVIALVILKLTLWHGATKVGDAELYAYYINYYSEQYNIDPAIPTAVIFRESSFDQYMVGKKGEVGLGQLLMRSPSTKDYDHLGRRALFDPNLNIMLTIRHLDRARRICHSTNPNVWLSIYNGWRPRNGFCYKTRYSRRVMSTYRIIKKAEAQNGT